MKKKILPYNIMNVNMRNVYVLCAVVLVTILVAYYLFTNNKMEMFNTLRGTQDQARRDQAISDYYLNSPRPE